MLKMEPTLRTIVIGGIAITAIVSQVSYSLYRNVTRYARFLHMFHEGMVTNISNPFERVSC